MRPEDVPMGDRILPEVKCSLCGGDLEVMYEAGDEDDTVYIGCENIDTMKKEEGHTEYRGVPRKDLIAWGWKI